MRKNIVFLALSLLVLVIFACEFIVPTAIEVKGSPEVRFVERIDLGKMFTGLLDDAITENENEMTVFPCSQTEIFTYLIHAELFTQEFDAVNDLDEFDYLREVFPGMQLEPDDIDATLAEDKILIDGSKDRSTIPIAEVGSLLTGFRFSEYKTILYFSGNTPLINKSKVNIIFEEIEVVDDEEIYTEIFDDIENRTGVSIQDNPSDIEEWRTNGVYTGTECPSGGVEFTIPITGKDIAISFIVYIPEGEELTLDDFEAGEIKVEVIVWLPFIFEAVDDTAEIAFPDDALFSSEDDLFGRDEPGAENMMTDIIESLSLKIVLDNNNPNPFLNSELVVWSGDNIEIINHITSNSLLFAISEENMTKINDPENWPFTPNFKIRFSSGDILQFPREFFATDFIFNAKIKYRMDL
jgi:hypothetical protein